MGSKKKNVTKKSNGKPCLMDPGQKRATPFKNKDEEKKLLSNLPPLLKQVFQVKLSSKDILQKHADESGISFAEVCKKKKLDRARIVDDWKEQNKPDLPFSHLKPWIAIGFQSCFRYLKREELMLLAFDENSGVENLKLVLEGAKCAVIGVNGLSNLIRESLGFPATAIGIWNNDQPDLKAFADIATNLKPVEPSTTPTKCEDTKSDLSPKSDPCPQSTTLMDTSSTVTKSKYHVKRNDNESRTFSFAENIKGKVSDQDFNADFIVLSEEPPEKKKRTNYIPTSLTLR